MSTRICFIRHGETDWNAEKRIQGQLDIPLNEIGRAQALAMASYAAHFDFATVYSSDLNRAKQTAEALIEGRGLKVKALPQLRERHYGIFQNMTKDDASALYPEAYGHYEARDMDYDFDTGESLRTFSQRVTQVVDWLAQQHTKHTIAVVAHAGVLDVLYRKATGRLLHTARDFVIPNCALNWFHIDGQGWHLDVWGDHYHLAGVGVESIE